MSPAAENGMSLLFAFPFLVYFGFSSWSIFFPWDSRYFHSFWVLSLSVSHSFLPLSLSFSSLSCFPLFRVVCVFDFQDRDVFCTKSFFLKMVWWCICGFWNHQQQKQWGKWCKLWCICGGSRKRGDYRCEHQSKIRIRKVKKGEKKHTKKKQRGKKKKSSNFGKRMHLVEGEGEGGNRP